MSRNFPITRHMEAAALLAEDVPVTEIARQFGVSRRTIYNWSESPEAKALIAEIQAETRAGVKHLAIANKVRRLHLAQQMVDGILAVIADRQAQGAAQDKPLPGEATGHVAVKRTFSEGGVTMEASFDNALHASMVKWLEYAAKELGDVETSVNLKHSGTVRHVHRKVDLSALTDDELDQLALLAEKIESGEVPA